MLELKLEFKERFTLKNLFPKTGNIIGQILVRDIGNKVDLTQDELTEYDVKIDKTLITWNIIKAKAKKIELTEAELTFLKDQVDRIDKAEEITPEILSLCLKIKDIIRTDPKDPGKKNKK